MICNNCGKVIGDDARFCIYCGSEVTAVNNVQQLGAYSPQAKRKGGKGVYIAVSVALVVLVAIVCICIAQGTRNKAEEVKPEEIISNAFKEATAHTGIQAYVVIDDSINNDDATGWYKNNAQIYSSNGVTYIENGSSEYFVLGSYGSGHSEDSTYSVYSFENGDVWRQLNDDSEFYSVYLSSMDEDEFVWFLDDISRRAEGIGLDDDNDFVRVTESDDGNYYLVTGTLDDAGRVGETYLKFMDYADFEPSHGYADSLAYTVTISVSGHITGISFNMGDLAKYAVFGPDTGDGLVANVNGTFEISYSSFDYDGQLTLPDYITSQDTEAAEEYYDDEDTVEVTEVETTYDTESTFVSLDDWKTVYTDYFNDYYDLWYPDLIDMNNDGIPEIVACMDEGGSSNGWFFYYIHGDSVVESFKVCGGGFDYTDDDIIHTEGGEYGNNYDAVYQYNTQTETYESLVYGESEYDYADPDSEVTYYVDGTEYTEDEYNAKMNELVYNKYNFNNSYYDSNTDKNSDLIEMINNY